MTGDFLDDMPDIDEVINNDDQLLEEIEFDYPLVSNTTKEHIKKEFGPQILEDYRGFKRDLLTWLGNRGKDNPDNWKGLAPTTLESTHYKLETVFRWNWKYKDKYTTEFTPDDADVFVDYMNRSERMIDSTVLHHAKDIRRYFKYIDYQKNGGNTDYYSWTPEIELSQKNGGDERQYLRKKAFKPLYEAALNHNSVKSYYNVTPEERDHLKTVLAQRLQKPKSEVGPEDFKKSNSWKYPSMIAVALDTGLRPIEMGRATTDWVNLVDEELNIPKEESTKNDAHWNCAIKPQTARALELWMDERDGLEKYQGTNALWLTSRGNPYSSKSCNSLLNRLLESEDIPMSEKQKDEFTWYSIRHGVATYWANTVGPHHAKDQLRHEDIKTTMKYLHSDADSRKLAVKQMW